MSDTIEAKNRKVKPAPKKTKLCLHCGRVKPIDGYYANKDWIEQLGYDVWCKDCVNRCANKEDIKEYFWENHREFTDKIWTSAEAKANKLAANNIAYQNSSDERRKLIMDRLTAQQIPAVMGMYYKYVDNHKENPALTYAEAKDKGIVQTEEDPNEKIYDKEFNGNFNKRDLEYLRNYYAELNTAFSFDTENLRDYARKVCKASLQADKMQDAFAAGRCSFADVKDAMAQFDMLSKSAEFAQCKRKTGDNSGLTCWAETTYKLETTGHTMQRKIEWPEDDVDKCIKNLRHLAASLGIDG